MLRFLLATPNQITISDVDLAMASEAMILGFNTEPSEEVQAAAKEKGALTLAPLPTQAARSTSGGDSAGACLPRVCAYVLLKRACAVQAQVDLLSKASS